jgi:hypothetical protein
MPTLAAIRNLLRRIELSTSTQVLKLFVGAASCRE